MIVSRRRFLGLSTLLPWTLAACAESDDSDYSGGEAGGGAGTGGEPVVRTTVRYGDRSPS